MKHQTSVSGGLGNLNALAHQRLNRQQQQNLHNSLGLDDGGNQSIMNTIVGASSSSSTAAAVAANTISSSSLSSSSSLEHGGSYQTSSTNNNQLVYFILATDPIFEKSKMVCALFMDGDDDWLMDARELARRVVAQFTEANRDAIDQLRKRSEETEDEEEEQQLQLYSSFVDVVQRMKLDIVSDRMKRKSSSVQGVV